MKKNINEYDAWFIQYFKKPLHKITDKELKDHYLNLAQTNEISFSVKDLYMEELLAVELDKRGYDISYATSIIKR